MVLLALAPPRVAAAAARQDDAAAYQRRAKEHAAANRYDLAAEEFLKEYAVTKSARTLLFVAECYRSLYAKSARPEHLREARRYYLDYLQREPAGELSARAREMVSVVDEELHRIEPPPAAPPADPKRAPDLSVERPGARPEALPAGPVEAADTTPLYKKWWVWTVVGVVAAGATVGIVMATRSGGITPPRGDFPMQTF
jgi:hypothetical protein